MMTEEKYRDETDELYILKARDKLLKKIQESPEDLTTWESLGKTLRFWKMSFPLEELREKYLKQTSNKRQELLNLLDYVMAIEKNVRKVFSEIIKQSPENSLEIVIAVCVIANKVISELARILREKILEDLEEEDTRLGPDPEDFLERR